MGDSSLMIAVGVLSLFRADTFLVSSDVAMQCGAVSMPAGEPVRVSDPLVCPHPAQWTIAIPGRISRRYRGTLAIVRTGGFLTPVIRMDSETAVAAAVAAEMPANAPPEALKAMAVLARSYYRKPRHRHYEFCDTTHCQFHRDPPSPAHPASHAVTATRRLVTTYRGRPFAPLYLAACGGSTNSTNNEAYPYASVPCVTCRRQPSQGRVPAHSLGVCQRGAIAMAAVGATFRDILRHYLPDATIE